MPRLVYQPEGADPRSWDFSFGRIMIAERKAIEKACGRPWDEVKTGFFDNDGAVIHAFLWVLMKRDMPTLTLAQVDFCEDDIDRDLTDDEARDMLAELERIELPDDAVSRTIDELRERLVDQVDEAEEEAPFDGAGEQEWPSPPAPADEPTTSSTST